MYRIKNYFLLNFKLPLFRVLPYVLPYWKTYICLVLLIFVNLSITVCTAWLLQHITDAAVNKNFHLLKALIMVGVGLLLLTSILTFINSYVESVAIHKVTRDLKIQLFNKTLRLRTEQFTQYHSGELLSRLTNDVNSAAGLVGSNLLELIRLPITSIAIFLYLISINWKLSLISLSFAPLLLLSGVFFGLLLKNNNKRMLEYLAKINSFLNDVFAGHSVVRSFSLERLLYGKYKDLCQEQYTLEVKYAKLAGGMSAGTSIAGGIAYFLNLAYGAYLVAHESLTVGALLAFISLMQHLVYPFMGMASCWSSFQHSISAFERVWEILGSPSAFKEMPIPTQSTLLSVSVEMKDICFSYDGQTNVIKRLNLNIPAGKVTAIVGPSGAGKSTLFKLLLGLYTPTSGEISFNGQLAKSVPYPVFRSLIAYVPQESYLFDGTIRENLLHGYPEAPEVELMNAAKDTNIHNFIISLPNQYDSKIGERGVLLSGGQKQRISIARAILKNAPLLLLDEATSSLDNENEYAIQQSLKKLMKGRTTIVIAHRLSTIQNADWIIVMNNGEIEAQGTHDTLLQGNNSYSRMYEIQNLNLEQMDLPLR